MHQLLRSQLRGLGLSETGPPRDIESWSGLLERINQTYTLSEQGSSASEDSAQATSQGGPGCHEGPGMRCEAQPSLERGRLQAILRSIGEAVITTDAQGRVEYLNPVAETLTQWPHPEARSRPLRRVLRLMDEFSQKPITDQLIQDATHSVGPGTHEHVLLLNREGTEIPLTLCVSRIGAGDGPAMGMVIVAHDVTVEREMAQQLCYQATHDPITGLYNRTEFERRLQGLFDRPCEAERRHVLLYIDLDQFKIVNDTCGHVAGDQLLNQIAYLFKEQLRATDTVARLGGDEFGILLECCPLDWAKQATEELLKAVREFRFSWGDKTFEIGASIGLTAIDTEHHTVSETLSAADIACYAAKDHGRNRVHIFEPDDTEIHQRRLEMQWVSRITEALSEDRFALACQPIIPLQSDRALRPRFETLVRMIDEQGMLISPGAFIPAAERYSLMPSIDRWLISRVFERLQSGGHAPASAADACWYINLSATYIADPGFLEFIRETAHAHHIPPRNICFEITETSAITHMSTATEFIRTLREEGFGFALDDFGSGMCSFSYLKALPVDYLKVDGSFVKDMRQDPIDCAMVRSINEIGHVMGKSTIAEFVEDRPTLELLAEIGVDFAQGYGICRPIPFETAYEWWTTHMGAGPRPRTQLQRLSLSP